MIAVLIMTFAAVFLTILALFLAVTAARQSPAAELKRKLRRMSESSHDRLTESLAADLLRESTSTDKLFYRLPLMGRIITLVEHSGVRISPLHFVFLTCTASAVIFLALVLLKGSLLVALSAAFMTALVPVVYLGYRRKQRENRFAEQLPDALSMIARSLRAGHSLTTAVELIGEEIPEPAGGLFKIAYEQQKLGMRMADALATLPNKINSMDLHFLVTIIKINSEAGGNLAEILEKLGNTITARLQIRRQVKVYTAEGRMSAYVLAILPVAMFVFLHLRSPDYTKVFFTEQICQLFLGGAILGQIIGYLIMRKIVDIRI